MRKIVYLLVPRGDGEEKRTDWKPAGVAFVCRDGSLNLKLDLFPNLTFNVRDAKSNAEAGEMNEIANGHTNGHSQSDEPFPEPPVVEDEKKGAKNARPKRVRQVRQ